MLLTIHNLPSSTRYVDVKSMLQDKCGLTELILDNLVNEGTTKKVTVGLADEGDAAILVRKINGLYVNGLQLYVEDKRKKRESEQPFRPSASLAQEAKRHEPVAQNLMGDSMVANMNNAMMMNYNMAGMYMPMQMMPIDQNMPNMSYMGYNGAVMAMPPEALAHEQRFGGYQGDSGAPSARDRTRRSPEAFNRSSRWNEPKDIEGPRREAPSPPRQHWPAREAPREFEQFSDRHTDPEWQRPSRFEAERRPHPEPQWEPEPARWQPEPEPERHWEPEPEWREPARPENEDRIKYWEEDYHPRNEDYNPERFDNEPRFEESYREPQQEFHGRREQPVERRSRRDPDWTPPKQRGKKNKPSSSRDEPWSRREEPHRPSRPSRPANREPKPPSSRKGPTIDEWREEQRQNPSKRPVPDHERGPPDWNQIANDYPPSKKRRSDPPQDIRPDFHRQPREDNGRPNIPPRQPRDEPGRPNFPHRQPRDEPERPNFPPRQPRDEPGRPSFPPRQPREDNGRPSFPPRQPREDNERPSFPPRQPRDEPGRPNIPPRQPREDSGRPNFPPRQPRDEPGRPNFPPRQPKPGQKPPAKPNRKQPITQSSLSDYKPNKVTRIINKDQTSRGQAAAKLYKQAAGSADRKDKNNPTPPHLIPSIVKELRSCIRSRIDVMLGEELTRSYEEIIERYRAKFPIKGDKALFMCMRDKVIQRVAEETGQDVNAVVKTENSETEVKEKLETAANKNGKQPKAEKEKLESHALTDKQIIREEKQIRKVEFSKADHYKLDPLTDKIVDEELAKITDIFASECKGPADKTEKVICNRIKNDSVNEFVQTAKLHLAKRLLNIRTGLAVRIFSVGKLPRRTQMQEYLKPYRIERLSIKRNKKGTMFVANIGNFEHYDHLCHLQNDVIDGTPIMIRSMYLVGPPPKLSKNQIKMRRQQFIKSQIDSKDDPLIPSDTLEPTDTQIEPSKIEPTVQPVKSDPAEFAMHNLNAETMEDFAADDFDGNDFGAQDFTADDFGNQGTADAEELNIGDVKEEDLEDF